MIARIQRQKRKYVTAVAGLDTVPDLKIKDAARVFGKKFSSGNPESSNVLKTFTLMLSLDYVETELFQMKHTRMNS